MQTDFSRRGLRDEFILAPDEIYLNAGTFSALPREVFDEQNRLRAAAESNPTRVGSWGGRDPFWRAQEQIAKYLGADPCDIIFSQNVTRALNVALFGLEWPEGGEIIAGDMEYGAIVNAAREAARRRGMSLRTFKIPHVPQSADEVYDAVIGALSPRTSCVLLSHVMSDNGLVAPIERIGSELRRRGILFFVDGAHGPGLVPLDLSQTDIDVYGGNLHKWFMGPKGTGFLYVAWRLHHKLQPDCVGWGNTLELEGSEEYRRYADGYRFQQVFRFQGLMDFSPFLALPATLRFRDRIGENRILLRITQLGEYLRQRMSEDIPEATYVSPSPNLHAGLHSWEIPLRDPAVGWQEEIYQRWKITVVSNLNIKPQVSLRISPSIWNDEDDIDRLIDALKVLTSEKGAR